VTGVHPKSIVPSAEAEKQNLAGKRSIDTMQMVLITYFATCGGPFGIGIFVFCTLVELPQITLKRSKNNKQTKQKKSKTKQNTTK
jgi:hypothetical protein